MSHGIASQRGTAAPEFATPTAETDAGPRVWKALQFLNLYRFIVAGLVVTVHLGGHQPFGSQNPALFFWVGMAYLGFAIAAAITVQRRRPAFCSQVYSHVVVDILMITLLMHASGGIGSGLGMLLVVTIAAGSTLMAGRTGGLFAAVASLAVLVEQGVASYSQLATANFPHAGLLGMTFFATALLSHALSRRIHENESLAVARGAALARMMELTEFVIERMQTGVLVVDADGRVHVMNESAARLLEVHDGQGRPLDQVSPDLADCLAEWRIHPEAPRLCGTALDKPIIPRFASLGDDPGKGIVVFLEDSTATAQQAQQLKLASLGRLTASIAHEVRNPLGAISHAGELLAESPALGAGDRRLIQIIVDHSRRVNTIIENILRLGRRTRAQPVLLELQDWLAAFLVEFTATHRLDPGRIPYTVEPANLTVRIDPTQLHQILWNLCQNALRHTADQPDGAQCRIAAGIMADSGRPFLEVVDHGPGIPAEAAEHIFEPFFTTGQGGTGLGLYIARELAESNQARLSYQPHPDGGARFLLTFPDPRRQTRP